MRTRITDVKTLQEFENSSSKDYNEKSVVFRFEYRDYNSAERQVKNHTIEVGF
ncbi:9769_t:CDS:2 [Diversispora eburnea]|uniref:9769_t:CDS:1 n=1 Tax=Diversispora eburnea TaxID=1213867 RepID=A0A9N9BAP6_9GLOM|nr:9769_t:CDS:2 [Diversispora eburnea]